MRYTLSINRRTQDVDAAKTHLVKELKHDSPLISCRFDPTGKYVFFGSQDYKVWRWQWQADSKVAFEGHDSWVRAIGFSTDEWTT